MKKIMMKKDEYVLVVWNPRTVWFERFLVFLFSNDIVDADLDKQIGS